MNVRSMALAAALLLPLSACLPGETDAERSMSIEGCGLMVGILTGDTVMKGATIDDTRVKLYQFSTRGRGPVKTSAQLILNGLSGKNTAASDRHGETLRLQDYCKNYPAG